MTIKSAISYTGYVLGMYALLTLGGCSSVSGPGNPTYVDRTGPASVHAEVVDIARDMLGTPYHYGGRSPKQGFDCSGLVYYANKRAGIHLPRTSYGQFKATRPVALRHLQPGDLVFFRFSRRKISHVGIYIGHNEFIHAPSAGKEVMIDELDDPYWRYRFVRGGRTL